MLSQRTISERIFDWPADELVLKASKCTECGNHMFPTQDSCMRCANVGTQEVPLATSGTLWSWTIQGFPPKDPYIGVRDPKLFEPYGVGYLDLDGQLKLEGRLTVSDPAQIEIGMRMNIVPIVLASDEDGTDVVTFAFEPAPDSPRSDQETSS